MIGRVLVDAGESSEIRDWPSVLGVAAHGSVGETQGKCGVGRVVESGVEKARVPIQLSAKRG